MSHGAKLAYIVLGHKRPDLLLRLLDRLSPAPVSVHIDAKAPMAPFAEVESRATLLPRHACDWGLFGHVAATLEGLEWFMQTNATHVALVTGQCYPVVSQDAVRDHLTALGERSRIRCRPLPIAEWGSSGGGNRIDRYWIKSKKYYPRAIKLLPRKLPAGLKPHGGGSYWCLHRKHAEYILDYVRRTPSVLSFFRWCLVPDEMLFHTILSSSRFADETEPKSFSSPIFALGSPHPKVLELDDALALRASGALFARKFEDHAVLDQLDERLALGAR